MMHPSLTSSTVWVTKSPGVAAGAADGRELCGLAGCAGRSSDRRYTLPSVCIGAAIQEHTIRAFAPNALYSADVDQQRFRSVDVTLPNDGQIEKFFGLTGGGRAIVGSGSRVYTILLPSN